MGYIHMHRRMDTMNFSNLLTCKKEGSITAATKRKNIQQTSGTC